MSINPYESPIATTEQVEHESLPRNPKRTAKGYLSLLFRDMVCMVIGLTIQLTIVIALVVAASEIEWIIGVNTWSTFGPMYGPLFIAAIWAPVAFLSAPLIRQLLIGIGLLEIRVR